MQSLCTHHTFFLNIFSQYQQKETENKRSYIKHEKYLNLVNGTGINPLDGH
jgi:hypothetical protein